jgi:hypothetical protein
MTLSIFATREHIYCYSVRLLHVPITSYSLVMPFYTVLFDKKQFIQATLD